MELCWLATKRWWRSIDDGIFSGRRMNWQLRLSLIIAVALVLLQRRLQLVESWAWRHLLCHVRLYHASYLKAVARRDGELALRIAIVRPKRLVEQEVAEFTHQRVAPQTLHRMAREDDDGTPNPRREKGG